MDHKLDAALQESEEAKRRLRDDIFAMLAASGYHRAQIDTIDEYDRITGGIAWVIKRYADVEVDANLLYEESAERNIKLRTEQSEAIMKALTAIKSPFELSAHQLQGLDYGALKNVVQWLIRRMLSRNQQKTNRNRRTRNWIVTDRQKLDYFQNSGAHKTVYDEQVIRHRKRMDNGMKFELSMDAKCTLAEYLAVSGSGKHVHSDSKSTIEAEDVEIQEDDNLQEASSRKHVATKSIIRMLENAVVDLEDVENSEVPLPEDISQKLAQLEGRLANEKLLYQGVKKSHEELLGQLKDVERKMGETDQKEIDQITELLKSFHATQHRVQELQSYEMVVEEDVKLQNSEETEQCLQYKQSIQNQYDQKSEEYSVSAREVQSLQFELDQLLGVNLSSHYRKRNMERLQNSADYTEEAKAAVIDYNVTVDILKFSGRITTFINELEKSLLAEARDNQQEKRKRPATQEYREAFVAYMNDVRTQLGEYHWKAKQSQDKTVQEKKRLEVIRSGIRVKEREVAFISGEIQRLLETNSHLQEVARNL